MDYFKKATNKNFTAWDLNCKCVKTDPALKKKFRRAARRKIKLMDKKDMEVIN